MGSAKLASAFTGKATATLARTVASHPSNCGSQWKCCTGRLTRDCDWEEHASGLTQEREKRRMAWALVP